MSKIETISTYDNSTEEFVLHTPTATAMKWWPGGLGNTVNHVLLMANLVINTKNYGPHLFVVPIREIETHKAFPSKNFIIFIELNFNRSEDRRHRWKNGSEQRGQWFSGL